MSYQDENNSSQMHHEYDGIVEHNNPMPTWWSWSFIFTVIFGFIYYIHYQVADGTTLKEELQISMAKLEQLREASGINNSSLSESDVMKKISDPESVKLGAVVFSGKCAVCHGNNLEGKIGPNLTDKFWIHGDGKPVSITQTIKAGVPAKGMPPWSGVITDDEVMEVTAFILSQKNTQPAAAKAPEGAEIADYF